ncbi:MAG: PVC-type heme-binding CxxCH protein [Gemmataceae bacterium]
MRTLAILFLSLSVIPSWAAPPDLDPARSIKVPPGFEVIKIAGPPLVDRPVVACFDNKGRLFVADSSGSNEKPTLQLEKKPHRIVMLEDTDGDGIFDKSTVFADQMSFLQGVMWKDGSLYVGAPPYIWKLTDTKGTGQADKREIWFDGKTLTGCANDLHGPYEGPDGFIYWTKGAFANQEYTLPDGKKYSSRCATIMRAKPDGSCLEPVMTGGMDNPVDVVFLPNGDRIFSTTFLQNPGNGKRDGLIHAVYGAVYGKDHGPVYELPWTSPNLMSPMTHMGPAAPAGLHRYTSNQLGNEFTGNLFCAQFNLRTVSRHILKQSGSTYVTEDSPFATSTDVDFHPTDVIEDADGSLIVVDTGGWYKLCCPSSQLVKTDVLGGIYRIRKIGSQKTTSKHKDFPLQPLYWVSLNRDAKGFDLAINCLSDSKMYTRRLAAEALGRIGDKRAVPALLKALEVKSNDEVLQHSLTYALMQIGDVAGTREGLKTTNERAKMSLLAALATMPNGIEASDLQPYIRGQSGNSQTNDMAWMILTRMKSLDVKIKALIRDEMVAQSPEIVMRISRMMDHPSIQEIILDLLKREDRKSTRIIFDMIRSSGKSMVRKEWYPYLAKYLKNAKTSELHIFVLSLRDKFKETVIVDQYMFDSLVKAASNEELSFTDRLSALRCLPTRCYPLTDQDFTFVMNCIAPHDKDAIPNQLQDIIPAIMNVRLNQTQWISLAKQQGLLQSGSPSYAMTLFDSPDARTVPVGLALVSALNTPEMRARIRVDMVKPIFDKYPEAVKKEAEKLYAELEKSRAGEIAKFEALIKELPAGDIRRGQVVFHSEKANCKACHTIGYVGGKIGPDLTRVGGIRTERDLLESIVFPSASFVRSYEPVVIETKDGRTFNGNVKSESDGEIVLTVAADQEVRIERKNIDTMQPGKVSVMPSGLDQQMTKQELADLVAFLKANK